MFRCGRGCHVARSSLLAMTVRVLGVGWFDVGSCLRLILNRVQHDTSSGQHDRGGGWWCLGGAAQDSSLRLRGDPENEFRMTVGVCWRCGLRGSFPERSLRSRGIWGRATWAGVIVAGWDSLHGGRKILK